jgi:hypothetical protein
MLMCAQSRVFHKERRLGRFDAARVRLIRGANQKGARLVSSIDQLEEMRSVELNPM